MPSLEIRAGQKTRASVLKLAKYESALVLLFVLSLPLSNPWVRGDGVGYYAFARSLLIEHRLDFTKDWQSGQYKFPHGPAGMPTGKPLPNQYTATGHLDNHFSVGPAILWAPFLVVAHAGVLVYDRSAVRTPADGFSKPYIVAMAPGTAVYGFLVRDDFFSCWRENTFPSVALFWRRSASGSRVRYPSTCISIPRGPTPTRLSRWRYFFGIGFVELAAQGRWLQWAVLGAIGGLMLDTYYVSGVLLLMPVLESLGGYWKAA